MARVKLQDVAKLAGVSVTTVSRVLNNRGYLSKQTINKVHQAMEELNYRPNAVARQLYKQRTDLVGLVFPTVNNPFFGQLEAELETRLYELGYRVVMGNSQNNPGKEEQYLQLLFNGQIDGLIVGAHNEGIEAYHNTNLPIVSIERIVSKQIPVVAADNYQGGCLATQRLLDAGCQHIIHTNYPATLATPNQERRRGYEELMTKYGREKMTYEISFDLPDDQKAAVFDRLFAEHPECDGIFADNDTNARLAINAAQKAGKRVPEDVKVIGYDGASSTRLLFPDLTTIQQPIPEMAQAAVDLLQKRLAGQAVESVTLPVKLIPGLTG